MTDWNARSFHGTHNRYPFTDIVSFMMRNYSDPAARQKTKVLDLGCGGGAHMVFLATEGFQTYGLDGNEESVVRANDFMRASGFADDCAVAGVFEKMPYEDGFFDVVLDRGAITCNEGSKIPELLGEVERVLKPGGRIFSMMLDVLGAEASGGKHIGNGDYTDFPGRLSGAGLLHLSNPVECATLFSPFDIESIERSVRYAYMPQGHAVTESWTIVSACKK